VCCTGRLLTELQEVIWHRAPSLVCTWLQTRQTLSSAQLFGACNLLKEAARSPAQTGS